MTEKEGGDDHEHSSSPSDPTTASQGVENLADSIEDVSESRRAKGKGDVELDEFGLPVPKLVVSSQGSSRDSFESAHSSINEEENDVAREDDDVADVEDNDVEEPEQTSPTVVEWPRLSRSTLPPEGHVKSSPFHTTPPKPSGRNQLYAERAKDLLKVSPVSNSVFKRQRSLSPGTPTAETPISRSSSTKSVSAKVESPTTPEEPLAEPISTSPKVTPIIVTPAETPQKSETKADSDDPPKVTISADISHSRNSSTNSNPELRSANVIFEYPEEVSENPSGASEWSHQLAVSQAQSHGSPDKSRKSDEWQSMEAYAAYDMYDDDGRLVAKQFQESDDEEVTKGGAGRGYTRMNQDEDAQSADSMDENTQYLFHESFDDEDATTPLSQMQATKELLTEGQRIAYVGLCKLTMVGMLRDVGRVRYKENRAAYESMTLWSQKMMIRLFGHMDISSAEQVMIEQLAEHGVIPADLVPALMINVEVANPLNTSSSASDVASLASQQSIPSASSRSSSPTPSTPSSPPPVQHPLALTSKKLSLDLRWTVLCDLFLVLIADSVYDARSRVLLERMGAHLGVEWLDITRFERRVTEALQIQESGEQNWKEDALIDSRAKQARNRRYMMMGLATLGGGLVLGLSAGLLAPVIGVGLGAAFTTVGITGTTGFLAGTGGAALIATGGVVAGSSIAGKGMARRTRNVQTFEFRPLHNNQRVNLLVTVSGWMSSKEDDVRLPFSTLDPANGDVISLLWEPETQTSMGQTINLLATEILTQSLQFALGQTVLVALISSIQWPMMLTKLSYLIDNPWSTSLDRARACGLLLADTLMNRHLGQRPISLAGYSLGARVVYYCLLELAKCKAYGLVQDVFLFGTPVIIKQKECLRAQSVVAGRFVNGYKSNDWILGYLFRASTTGVGRVAGLRPIENCGDIENLDCTELVGGHLLYREAMPKLMKEVGFLVLDEEFGEIEDPDPDKHRERQIQLYEEIEEAKKLVAEEEAEAIRTGKKVKRRTKKSGFLGLWGRDIDAKPVGLEGSAGKKLPSKQSSETPEYDPTDGQGKPQSSEALRSEKGNSTPSNPAEENDSNVLFDVDKMREELAANGITMRSLESTLPPLVVKSPPPPPTPPIARSQTSPVTATIHRAHSPSLPAMVQNPPVAGNNDLAWDMEPRNITPHRELDKLVVNTKTSIAPQIVSSPASPWDDDHTGGGEITMMFEPESPKLARPSMFHEPYVHHSYSTSISSITASTKEIKPTLSMSHIPIEKNVWDDDDLGTGGDITMSFE